nr:MAG TPA: hypothetical protein [Caudoviricetes sp.]
MYINISLYTYHFLYIIPYNIFQERIYYIISNTCPGARTVVLAPLFVFSISYT